MSDHGLSIRGLTKRYLRDVIALADVNLEIGSGVWGLLGPNGAGKTTLMKILATLLRPDRGRVYFDALDVLADPMAIRRQLGYLPQEYGFYPSFTAARVLDYFGTLKGVEGARVRRRQVGALLERVNLAAAANVPVGEFSTGMRQRLGVAQALLGNPRLLIVDEPTAGLDPEERLRLHNLLAEVGHSVIVVLSTHIVSDVAALCSRFAVLQHGRVVADTTPGAAVEALQERVFEGTIPVPRLEELSRRCRVLSRLVSAPGFLRVKVFSAQGSPADGFTRATATLDDVYFQLVGECAGRA